MFPRVLVKLGVDAYIDAYIGRFLSQAPTILMLLGKTFPYLLQSRKKMETALLHVALACGTFAPRDFLRWTVVRRWSPRSRENDL